jgi:hypothetical protein
MLSSADCCDVVYFASCVALSALLVAALRHTVQLICSCSGVVVCGDSSLVDRQVSPGGGKCITMTNLFRNLASAVCNLETGERGSESRRVTGKTIVSLIGLRIIRACTVSSVFVFRPVFR